MQFNPLSVAVLSVQAAGCGQLGQTCKQRVQMFSSERAERRGSVSTAAKKAKLRRCDVWTACMQAPAALTAACSSALLAAAILSSYSDMKPNHSFDPRGGQQSRLTFLCFLVNRNYSSYLMMQKESNMTFEVTILYCGITTPHPQHSEPTNKCMNC